MNVPFSQGACSQFGAPVPMGVGQFRIGLLHSCVCVGFLVIQGSQCVGYSVCKRIVCSSLHIPENEMAAKQMSVSFCVSFGLLTLFFAFTHFAS